MLQYTRGDLWLHDNTALIRLGVSIRMHQKLPTIQRRLLISHAPAPVSFIHTSNFSNITKPLEWCHNEQDGVSNHQPHDCFLNRLFRRRFKKTSKPRVTGLCAGNSPVTGEFPAQRASNAENVSIWRRHHGCMFRMAQFHSVGKLAWLNCELVKYPI